MAKSKRAVIQDDILAVKHALANGLGFEGLEGDDLKDLLLTLQDQRADVIASAKATAPPKPSTSKGSSKAARPKVKAATPKQGNKASQGASSARAETTVLKAKTGGKTLQAALSGKRQPKRPEGPSEGGANACSSKRSGDRLRQLRKSIKVGDMVSVLMQIRVTEGWVRSWVRGEVTREMNRSGIFLIAFDHDKNGKRLIKQEPGAEVEQETWIHEQRLEIDHPNFFCGVGNDPPRGTDEGRPSGAWYLHDTGAAGAAGSQASNGPAEKRLCV